MSSVYSIASLIFLLVNGTQSFAPHGGFVPTHRASLSIQTLSGTFLTSNHLIQPDTIPFDQSLLQSYSSSSALISEGSVVGILQTVGIVLASVVALILLLSFLTANILLPQAAKDFEEQTKERYPDLWQGALSRLEEGETLAMRPDLIQEYGRKLQDRMAEDFVAQQQALQRQAEEVEQQYTSSPSITDTATSWSDNEKTTKDF